MVAMLDGLLNVAGTRQVLPFVLMLCGAPSADLWDGQCGSHHTRRRARGRFDALAVRPAQRTRSDSGGPSRG